MCQIIMELLINPSYHYMAAVGVDRVRRLPVAESDPLLEVCESPVPFPIHYCAPIALHPSKPDLLSCLSLAFIPPCISQAVYLLIPPLLNCNDITQLSLCNTTHPHYSRSFAGR
ncbi:hypothetical protein Q8A73_019901 [Channa argus]|nr:hypothetical protein Q8A73_019901 [Channa argus]